MTATPETAQLISVYRPLRAAGYSHSETIAMLDAMLRVRRIQHKQPTSRWRDALRVARTVHGEVIDSADAVDVHVTNFYDKDAQ